MNTNTVEINPNFSNERFSPFFSSVSTICMFFFHLVFILDPGKMNLVVHAWVDYFRDSDSRASNTRVGDGITSWQETKKKGKGWDARSLFTMIAGGSPRL